MRPRPQSPRRSKPTDRADYGRIQGRAGVALRKARLAQEPLCRECRRNGKVRASTTPDHILPLALGGTDTDDNIQCLCEDCHATKTASEANHFASLNHPDWLEPSAIPLTIVSGPPASGKTTYVLERSLAGDTIISLDDILTALRPAYRHWAGMMDKELFNRAVRERNRILGQLKRKTEGHAWFIISAPTEAERRWWQCKLGGETVLLNPGAEECKRRATARGTPNAIDGIDKWERASRQPWQAPTAQGTKPTYGLDGWPTE